MSTLLMLQREVPEMDYLEGRVDELEELEEELEGRRAELQRVREEVSDLNGQRRRYVENTLRELQENLEEDDEVVLIDAEEFGRGGHYSYNETLTPEGIVAGNVENLNFDRDREYSSKDLYLWKSDEEPLDIDRYITSKRARPKFIGKLSERIKNLKEGIDKIPSKRWSYN